MLNMDKDKREIKDLILSIFPKIGEAKNGEEIALSLLWSRTGFPFFWPDWAIGKSPLSVIAHQLKNHKRAVQLAKSANRRVCDLCNKLAVKGDDLCKRCQHILNDSLQDPILDQKIDW